MPPLDNHQAHAHLQFIEGPTNLGYLACLRNKANGKILAMGLAHERKLAILLMERNADERCSVLILDEACSGTGCCLTKRQLKLTVPQLKHELTLGKVNQNKHPRCRGTGWVLYGRGG